MMNRKYLEKKNTKLTKGKHLNRKIVGLSDKIAVWSYFIIWHTGHHQNALLAFSMIWPNCSARSARLVVVMAAQEVETDPMCSISSGEVIAK